MTTATYQRRVGKTGRPLGMLDVLSKILETATGSVAGWMAARREAQLAAERSRARRDAVRESSALRRLADRHRSRDGRFAADLYAAADHHERLHGH